MTLREYLLASIQADDRDVAREYALAAHRILDNSRETTEKVTVARFHEAIGHTCFEVKTYKARVVLDD